MSRLPSPEVAPSAAEIVIVLVAPQHPGNIGAAARAMLVMGFDKLRLVRPSKWPHPESFALASGAARVLDEAQLFDNLADAVQDCAWVVGTSSRQRHLGDEPLMPWDAAAQLVEASASQRVALVFGCERTGLTNEEVELCHALTLIPANPDYPSLNLGNAVQLYTYEMRKAALRVLPTFAPKKDHPAYQPPTAGQVENFYGHLEKVLLHTGFLDPANPGLLMRRLRMLFNRARLDLNEVNILRGILTSVEKPKRRSHQAAPDAAESPQEPLA